MNVLEELISFPIVMVDLATEEKKEKESSLFNSQEAVDIDMIYGEAQVPFWDFLCINDRWLPTQDSIDNARSGKFDACSVSFKFSGTYCVPWSKAKFMKHLSEFVDKLPELDTVELELTPDQIQKLKEQKSGKKIS